MKRFLKIISIILGGVLLAGIAAAAGLYVATKGDYPVPATVSEDPNLPSMVVNDVRLHLETFGDPEHPVVIVLHGGPGGDYQSLLGLRELSDAYYIVFYDQRGAGLSERTLANQLSINAYIEELDAIVTHFGAGEPVSIVGHSWGAMLLAGYLGEYPEKVDKAILAEPGFLNAEEMQAWMEYQTRFYNNLEYLWFATRTGFEAQHVSLPDEQAKDDYLYTRIVHYFANHPDNPYHCPGAIYDAPIQRFGAIASQASSQATPDEINALEAGAKAYPNPVLLMAGACNTWIGPELQAKHLKLFSDARLIVIPDAGHDMFWDNPQESILAVRQFLSEE